MTIFGRSCASNAARRSVFDRASTLLRHEIAILERHVGRGRRLGLLRVRRLSVRRRVLFGLATIALLAVAQMFVNLRAIDSAAFMLNRNEISFRQLRTYQQLSSDVLEFIVALHRNDAGDVRSARKTIAIELAQLDALTAYERTIVYENDGTNDDREENAVLIQIETTIGNILGLDARNSATAELIYAQTLKPLMNVAITREQHEAMTVELSMQVMRGQIRWFGRLGFVTQLIAMGAVLLLIIRSILNPLSGLVADIKAYRRGDLGHRISVFRHDEFGLLALHINRMALHLDRERQTLLALNDGLETIVAERTRSLQERNDELRDIDDSRRRFFSDVSHELRTPLTAIVGETEVTLRIGSDAIEDYRETLFSVLANSSFLNRRIDDLMALARSSDGQIGLDFEQIDLRVVVADALSEIRSLAKVNRVSVHTDPCPDIVLVNGDRKRLRQCLMVLLDNAVKFSRPFQNVEITLTPRNRAADLTVADNGKGIAAQDLPRVFERFYQTASGQRMGGTGLGLSIAQRIVEAHHGTIRAASAESGGTSITMTLPTLSLPII